MIPKEKSWENFLKILELISLERVAAAKSIWKELSSEYKLKILEFAETLFNSSKSEIESCPTVLMDSNFENKKNFYSKVVNECVSMVDGLLKESDSESSLKLTKVKDKLLEDVQEIKEEEFLTKISKLIELKNNLKTN